jgi:hypothetical protein
MVFSLVPRSLDMGLAFVLLALAPAGSAQLRPDGVNWDPPKENNIWFAPPTASDTVFVFVHGLHSHSATCWLVEERGQPTQYWPYLVLKDERLGRPSVFLGGYTLGQSGNLFQASVELEEALENSRVLVLYRNIVFIAHSMGGVVVRRMLVNFKEKFRGKKLGLLFFASPSGGSDVADWGSMLLSIWGIRRPDIDRLRTDSIYLQELDQEFHDLLVGRHQADSDRLDIKGADLIEQDGYGGTPVLVVPWLSAARDFPEYKYLSGDHSSIVKPTDQNSPSHKFVVDFYKAFMSQGTNGPLYPASAAAPAPDIRPDTGIRVRRPTTDSQTAAQPETLDPQSGGDSNRVEKSRLPDPPDALMSYIWSLVKRWCYYFKIGDFGAWRDMYAERLVSYYTFSDFAVDDIIVQEKARARHFSQRDVRPSHPEFRMASRTEVDVKFDSSYFPSGAYVKPQQNERTSIFRFAWTGKDWKIVSQW